MRILYDNCFLLFFVRKSWLCDQLLIYVRNSIPYKHRPDLSAENIESSWVEVNRLKSKKLFVDCVYRPPNACSETFIDLLYDSSKLPKKGASFKLKRQLRQFVIANDLKQFINSPTRICEQTRTAIDVVFVNNTHRFVESGIIHSAMSDHSIVDCTMKSGVPKNLPKTIEYRSYRKYDKSSFIKDLKETDWNMVGLNGDVDPAVEMWNTLFTDFANRHAPIKNNRIKVAKTPWMTSDLKNAMRDRDFHYAKAIKTNSKCHWEMYKKMKNFTNKEVKKYKAGYYSDLINKNKGNPSEFVENLQ